MKIRDLLYSGRGRLFQFFLMFFWLLSLRDSSSYFSVNTLITMMGVCCLGADTSSRYSFVDWRAWVIFAVSVIFSGAVILANYDLFFDFSSVWNFLPLPFVFLGGVSLAWNILFFLYRKLPKEIDAPTLTDSRHAGTVYLASFAAISGIYLSVFFFAEYPGNLTDDSLNQLAQITSGVYSNHHPYWHTILIEVCVKTGLAVFGNYNDAVAVYHVCQILFMVSCFSYTVVTLYQAGIPKRIVVASALVYMLAPYHIAYSFTMWKDVIFGGAAVLLVTSLFRILKGIGKSRRLNFIILATGSIAFCIWRTNGWMALLATFLLCFLFLWKDHKQVLAVWAVVLVVGWVMKGPVITAMRIPQPDTVESLSIPVQQIARTIHDGRILTEDETVLLERVMDLEEVPELYLPYLSDPIKDEIRSKDADYFSENVGTYLKVWLQLGLRNPGTYVKAWVDQTKGYWNGGYRHYITISLTPPVYDMYKPMEGRPFYNGIMQYFYSLHNIPLVEFVGSIGLHVWAMAVLFLVAALHSRKEAMLTVPILMVVGTLLVATPVYCEFRYAYTVFTTLPLILPVTLYSVHNKG